MQLRRLRSHRLTLLAAGALLASTLLSGCGFGYQTNRINTISAGTNDRAGTVDVLGAVVIAGQDDVGLFVATLVNKDLQNPISLEGIEESDRVQPEGTEKPLEIAPNGRVSLFQTGGLAIDGTFKAGQFVPVTLTFSNGQATTVNVSVVPPCHQYSLDKLTELTLPTGTPTLDPGTGTESAEPSEDTSSESTEEPSEGASEGAEEDTDAYSCTALPAVEHGGGEGEGTE
ncbi:copper chaperone PCu(A)C [Nocardioides plantarum]|uniref:Copper chaperone PCu(A)C n=1 Tax=Nocardioides plantarum TaxID=29299 RepID=A0ABV5K976_9ACTN|nr:copper chaperone PCu(A)C [Nocardioides plantarum]